jgi:hypothetical protein
MVNSIVIGSHFVLFATGLTVKKNIFHFEIVNSIVIGGHFVLFATELSVKK